MNNKGSFNNVGIVIITIVVSFIIVVINIFGLINKIRISSYDKVNCLIVDRNDDNSYKISYEINEIKYEEDMFFSREYNNGDVIGLYYDGNNPNILFEDSIDFKTYVIVIFISFTFFIASIIYIKRYINTLNLLINNSDDAIDLIKDGLLRDEDNNLDI